MYKQFLLLCGALLALVSCVGEFEPDPIDPRLPVYSQEGRNTAGALVNGQVWRALQYCSIPMGCDQKLRVHYYKNELNGLDSVRLWLYGGMQDRADEVAMTFVLKGHQLVPPSEFPILAGVYQIDGLHHKAYYDDCAAAEGRLEIRHEQRLGEGDDADYFLAGTFSMYVHDGNCGLVKVEYGRFDYRL